MVRERESVCVCVCFWLAWHKSCSCCLLTFVRIFLAIGTATEGLFRIPGAANIEKQLRAMYNKTGAKEFMLDRVPGIGPHDVAGIFKLFFRELPEALCGELFDELVSISSMLYNTRDNVANSAVCWRFASAVHGIVVVTNALCVW
jgi:hypothetical protein